MHRLYKYNYWRNYYVRKTIGWALMIMAGLAVSTIALGVGSMIAGLIIASVQ